MMKTRGVAFNIEDPAQADLYLYTKQFKNFSAYIKGLIERDKTIRNSSPAPIKKVKNSNSGGIEIRVGV